MTDALLRRASHLDAERLRADFPILERTVNGHPLAYLDSAATSQKPRSVLAAIDTYYERSNANVHRGVHTLGTEATEAFEDARLRVAAFIDADPRGLVMVRNATEALNLVASSYGRELLGPGDRVVLTVMEHHSTIVPWQLAAERAGFDIAYVDIDDEGRLDEDDLAALVTPPTKVVAVTHQSNVLGTMNDIARIAAMAHAAGAICVVDACQSVPHMPVSVRDLGVDALAFSGHKMLGPMGAGALWMRPELLERMPPFLGGGSMISRVTTEGSTWADVPHKFEAGTPDVASAVGLAAACDYLTAVGLEAVHEHEVALTRHLVSVLEETPGVLLHGPRGTEARGGIASWTMGDIHPHDIASILDASGVEVRAGHHCCQPLMRRLGVASTARASVYLYSTHADIDALERSLGDVRRYFGV